MGPDRQTVLIFVLGICGGIGGVAARGASPAAERPKPELVLYTYDSFVAKGGLGPAIFPIFERKCGCKVRALPAGDGGQLLTRLQLDAERGNVTAQLVVGVDEPTWQRAKPWLEIEETGTLGTASEIVPEVRRELALSGASKGFFPYDYGYFAFVADRKALGELKLEAPARFSDLLKPEWKRNLILEDPRTSTPGLAFLLYADALRPEAGSAGEGAFWKSFRSRWLTLAPGWDSAYGLFLRKEAPLVWSYTTSQAYHEEHGDARGAGRRYRALVFEDGQPMQIEGSALVKGGFSSDPRSRELARRFLEFLISPEVQDGIPRLNWMYPVRKGGKLPASFESLPRPGRIVHLPMKAGEISAALARWTRSVESSR